MKRLMVTIVLFLLFSVNMFCFGEGGAGIKWHTNYSAAINEANVTNKPLVLFFTGSDWCTWCVRLEEEVLNTGEFAQAANDKFVFVKLDFPMQHPLDPKTTQQNKDLQRKYGVNSYPTVIVIDSNGRRLGTPTGYQKMSGAEYAQHLQERLRG